MNEHKDTEIQPVDNISLLSPEQLVAIPLLATGARVKDVAKEIGKHPNSVTRWSRTCPAFASELDLQKKELYHAGLQKALAVLDEHLELGSRLEQFRAANARLQYDAQLKRSNISVDVKHSIIDKLARTAADLPDSIDAEYAELAAAPLSPSPLDTEDE